MNYSNKFPTVEKLNGKKAIFLLGTDKYIGEEGQKEQRVGVTPDQVGAIKDWLSENGVQLVFYFVKDAGINAGFSNEDYMKVGGKVLEESELPKMETPNLVHALKEPAKYEENIPGTFIRIGALHTGNFSPQSGLTSIILKRNFCGIFDGSNTGTEVDIPIRKSMSKFAGEIAAEDSVEHFNKNSITNPSVVIFGGGIAGQAALNKLIETNGNTYKKITVVDSNKSTLNSLVEKHNEQNFISFIQGSNLINETIQESDAVILAAFRKGFAAPDALKLEDIKSMSDNSIIIDISIDEGGSIAIPDFNRFAIINGKKDLKTVIDKTNKAITDLKKNITYNADDHMPRRKPQEASIAHGDGIMPYISILLYYSAKLGSTESVIEYVFQRKYNAEKDILLLHLRNGLAFTGPKIIGYNSNIIKDDIEIGAMNKTDLETFLKENNIPFEPFE